ncbi:MAG: RDD family protein [Chitinophagales bacterium]
MAKIDVITTQKVTIQYDTAGFMWRFIAWMIDMSVIALIFMGILYFLFTYNILSKSGTLTSILIGMLIVIQYFYTLVLEVLTNGQSIGKKITGIAVIKLNGNALEMNDYLIRWAYRVVDFGFSGFSIGTISILMSAKNQRLGDMIADTTVVKLKPDRIVTLEDLQNLPDKDDYVPRFPQVTQYSDAEMLTLKNVLVRYQQYNNPIYRQLLADTVRKIKAQLVIEEDIRMDDVTFLKEIISEYVILTR